MNRQKSVDDGEEDIETHRFLLKNEKEKISSKDSQVTKEVELSKKVVKVTNTFESKSSATPKVK